MMRFRNVRMVPSNGFSLLELLVVIIIISALLAIAIDRLAKLHVVAERAAMETVFGHLQSAISLAISDHVASNNIPGLKKYINTNPMDQLADEPVNYLGSFAHMPKNIETGSWWYDSTSKTLLYHVGNRDNFQTDGLEKGVAKFKILPVYDDINRNGRFDRSDKLVGLKLTPLSRYRWLNEPIDPAEYARSTE